MTRISVIIVSFNAPFFLKICLESVRSALGGIGGEIIVVDNASQEGCAEMIRRDFPEVLLVINKENLGFSKAVNRGAKEASGEFILILNPDAILPEHILESVLNFAGDKPKLGAVGCRFIDGRGELLPECKRNIPGIRAAIFKLFGVNWGYYANDPDERETGQVEVLTGAFMFMRRELFQKLKGFDERFFMFGEDIDLSYRIHQAGYRNYYLGSVSIVHFKGESSVKNAEYLKHFYGALRIFYLKHFRHHALGRAVLNVLVEMAIWLRRKEGQLSKSLCSDPKSYVYVGQRDTVFSSLKLLYPEADSSSVSNVHQLALSSEGCLFFDSHDMPYTDIVLAFDRFPTDVQKRIIDKSGDFFIGSDAPAKRGQAKSMIDAF